MIFSINVEFLQTLTLLLSTQNTLKTDLENVNIVSIYQPFTQGTLYGDTYKVIKAPEKMTNIEAKSYCKNMKADLYFVSSQKPQIDLIFDNFSITEVWDGSYFSVLTNLILDNDGNIIEKISGSIVLEVDNSMNTITKDHCVIVTKEANIYKYKAVVCTEKRSTVCIRKNNFMQKSSTILNLENVKIELMESIDSHLSNLKVHLEKMKKLFQTLPEGEENENLEIIEQINLQNIITRDMEFLKATNLEFLNALKTMDHSLDSIIILNELHLSFETTKNILQNLYDVIEHPNCFLTTVLSDSNSLRIFRESNKILVFAKNLISKDDQKIPVKIPGNSILESLNSDLSQFDVALSSILILTLFITFVTKMAKNHKIRKARRPIVRQILSRKMSKTEMAELQRNVLYTKPSNSKRLPLHLSESLNNITNR